LRLYLLLGLLKEESMVKNERDEKRLQKITLFEIAKCGAGAGVTQKYTKNVERRSILNRQNIEAHVPSIYSLSQRTGNRKYIMA
jgi:hypothetical protein